MAERVDWKSSPAFAVLEERGTDRGHGLAFVPVVVNETAKVVIRMRASL